MNNDYELLELNDEQKNFYVFKSVVLAQYLSYWGSPDKIISVKKEDCFYSVCVFIDEDIVRVLSLGNSYGYFGKSKKEFLLVTTTDDFKAHYTDLIKLMINVMLNDSFENTNYACYKAIPTEFRGFSHLLLDELRGEPESTNICLGGEHIEILWLVPIYDHEDELLMEHGFDEFDRYIADNQIELVDLLRPKVE